MASEASLCGLDLSTGRQVAPSTFDQINRSLVTGMGWSRTEFLIEHGSLIFKARSLKFCVLVKLDKTHKIETCFQMWHRFFLLHFLIFEI